MSAIQKAEKNTQKVVQPTVPGTASVTLHKQKLLNQDGEYTLYLDGLLPQVQSSGGTTWYLRDLK